MRRSGDPATLVALTAKPGMIIDVKFTCPVCKRFAALKGTPERCVEIARSFGWQELKAEQVGPLPSMACSIGCWQKFWLESDDALMRGVVERMSAPPPAGTVLN